MITRMKNAATVGGFVLLFAGLGLGAKLTLGQSLFAPPTAEYKAAFADAGGVVSGSPVLLSGVNIGQVREVRLERAGRAVVVLAVNENVQIPTGTEAVLTQSLVGFGDKPVELIPPVALGAPLPKGAEIPGRIKSSLEGVIPNTDETLKELNATLRATQKLMGDTEMRDKVVTLLDSSNKTITEFGILANRINAVATENQSTVRKTLLQASAIMADVSKTTRAIARISSDGKLEGKMTGLLDEMNASVKQGNGLIADLRKTMNDPELVGPMKQIVANTETMTESGTKIAANAEVMTANGIELSEKAIEIAEKASKLADELSGLLKKADDALGKVGGIASGAKGGLGTVETEAVILRETEPGRTRAEFRAMIPVGKDQYTIGLWDAFESNKLIAQIGRPMGDNLNFRYGVFASKPGVGVEYRLAPGVMLRGDVFDVNEPRFDLRSEFSTRNNFRVLLGLDRVFGSNSPTFGISIRR